MRGFSVFWSGLYLIRVLESENGKILGSGKVLVE